MEHRRNNTYEVPSNSQYKTTSSSVDTDKDLSKEDRRKIQNRIAQRNYRKNIKQRAQHRENGYAIALSSSIMSTLPLDPLEFSKSRTCELEVALHPTTTATTTTMQQTNSQPSPLFSTSAPILPSGFPLSNGAYPADVDYGRDIIENDYRSPPSSPSWIHSSSGHGPSSDHGVLPCNGCGMVNTHYFHTPSSSADTTSSRSGMITPNSVGPASSTLADNETAIPSMKLQLDDNKKDIGLFSHQLLPGPSKGLFQNANVRGKLRESYEFAPRRQIENSPGSTTTLHITSENGHEHAVRFLLDKGANVNAVDNCRQTPLHLAAANGHLGVVQILLENNADPDVTDAAGRVALHRAAEVGNEAILRMLIDYGADLHKGVEQTMNS